LLNKHQKKGVAIELYKQGKTRPQIAETVHMSFKDIADIINEYTGEAKHVNKPEKSKDSRAFELFLQGKQSVEVAIELDMPADKVEELRVQYWKLSNLDNLEIVYYETKYSLPMLLQLHNILKENRITKGKDICELIELGSQGLPDIRNRFEELLNQVATLENEKAALNTEILGLRNSIYTNNEIIRKKNLHLRTLDRKLRQLEVMLQNANKEPKYYKVTEIIDRRLNDKRSLLLAALIAVLSTLKANPHELNYVADDIDGDTSSFGIDVKYHLTVEP
jgi:hypothetical protein